VSIFSCTLNCGGQLPESSSELKDLFNITPEEVRRGFDPDIYVIGLQEIVKLNAKNCFIKDNKRVQAWRDYLIEILNETNKRNIVNSGRRYTDEEIIEQ